MFMRVEYSLLSDMHMVVILVLFYKWYLQASTSILMLITVVIYCRDILSSLTVHVATSAVISMIFIALEGVFGESATRSSLERYHFHYCFDYTSMHRSNDSYFFEIFRNRLDYPNRTIT